MGTGCKESTYTTVVEGVVINTGSRQGIDSVLVTLQDGVSGTAGGFNLDMNTSSGKKNQVYTDANGAFRVELTGEHRPWLNVGKKGYAFYLSDRENVMGSQLSFPTGYTGDVVIEMSAEASFAPVLFSKEATGGDVVRFNDLPYEKLDTLSDINKFIRTFNGVGPFAPYRNGVWSIGDKYRRYYIELNRDNTFHSRIDSVYIKAFETYRDTIYY
ncbi:hypothetical protein SAMN03080601_00102 [Alkalitalea saponilacus]|uniref:Uncharacterized protein n=2 Tax=Alkalitalea saponilacus TaxID=889453 RepID=A0A1T5A633_9BACT|nr:hypothetical protein SAMN03080601_00102 [Alkalitalea saponilacus]